MAGKLYGLDLLGLAHTYDSGGQIQAPGVMVGNETMNFGLAPDNDPADRGFDVFANVANGTGPQYDGHGMGVYVDLDTNSSGNSVAGVDDSDNGPGSDLAAAGTPGETADDGYLAVHLSGVGDHAVDGVGQPAEHPPSADLSGLPVDDVPVIHEVPSTQTVSDTAFGLGLLGFDHT
jgi:hypothetical protein